MSEGSTDPTPARPPSASAREIYREVFTEAVAGGRNAMAIWQDLVNDYGSHCAVREPPPLRREPTGHRCPPRRVWWIQHGPAVVEDAAKAAVELGVSNYRFVGRYLDQRPSVPLTLRQVDPLRQLTLYRDLIDRKIGDCS